VQVDIRSCALEFGPEIASFKPRRLSLALRVLAHPHDAAGRREALNGYPGIERGFLDKILSCHMLCRFESKVPKTILIVPPRLH